jgi:tRNA(fMet)-specific endonuclease VapC
MAVKGIVLDTNAYAAFKRGSPEAVEIIRHVPLIAVSSIVLGELLAGFAVGSREMANRQGLDQFLASDRVKLFPIDHETARHYASIYRGLRRIGHPIPTNDLWIAAAALQHGFALFSYDTHFQVVDGLVVVRGTADLLR